MIARAEREGFAQIVRHHDYGEVGLVPDALHQHMNVGANARVERAERLVQKQDPGLAHKRLGKREALLHAARQADGYLSSLPARPTSASSACASSRAARRFAPIRRPNSARHLKLPADHDVLNRGQMGKHGVALEDHAAIGIRLRLERLVVAAGSAPGRPLLAEQHAKERRLAAAGRTDEHQKRARLDLEVDLLEHDVVAILFPDIARRRSRSRRPRLRKPGIGLALQEPQAEIHKESKERDPNHIGDDDVH